ncbi:hypothetical protein EDC04DRAFT_3095565 [Pisolithus marmoratus]|nr:hypothetical protein EDC04DRAFT_3095565 [Pisolithus marmoratus]
MGLFGWFRWSKKTTNIALTDMVVFSWVSTCKIQTFAGPTNSQKPGTTDVHAERCSFEGIPNDIVLVDMPSFYTYEDPDGEEIVKKWMDSWCTNQCKKAGILYMHNIASNPFHANLRISKHLRAFRRTLPRNFAINAVHVVPTMALGAKLHAERVDASITALRGQAVDVDATMSTIPDERPEMAWDIVQELLNKCEIRN